MLGVESCHDGDEWIGVFNDILKLKRAYERVQNDLKKDGSAMWGKIMIYEFEINKQNYKRVFPKELWGCGDDKENFY